MASTPGEDAGQIPEGLRGWHTLRWQSRGRVWEYWRPLWKTFNRGQNVITWHCMPWRNRSWTEEPTEVAKLALIFVSLKKLLRSSLGARWVEDPVLSLQWLGLLLWCGFHPWPGTFHMPRVQPKKKKKKKEKRNCQPSATTILISQQPTTSRQDLLPAKIMTCSKAQMMVTTF